MTARYWKLTGRVVESLRQAVFECTELRPKFGRGGRRKRARRNARAARTLVCLRRSFNARLWGAALRAIDAYPLTPSEEG